MDRHRNPARSLGTRLLIVAGLLVLPSCWDWEDSYTLGPFKSCPEDFQCEPEELCLRGECHRPELSEEDLEDADALLGIEWVCLPAGSFMMGCPEPSVGFFWPVGVDCHYSSAAPTQHEVEMQAYCLMHTEVTEEQFERVMGLNASFYPLGPDYPVEHVDWSEARLFCERIGARLPTEAEWEYAVQGAAAAGAPCEDEACLDATEWIGIYSQNQKQPVGTKLPNANGLFDLQGNVSEIVEDCFHPDNKGAPSTGYPAWSTGCKTYSRSGIQRTEKGNNYADMYSHWCCRSPFLYRYSTRGFRCAADSP